MTKPGRGTEPARPARVLFTERQIRARLRLLARRMEAEYAGDVPVLVGILNGCFIFLADLVREIRIPVRVDFIHAASYGTGQEPGPLRHLIRPETPWRGQRLILVDDILDTGQTLGRVAAEIRRRHRPRDIRTCVLLDKRKRRPKKLHPDFAALSVPDVFVAGYGLDDRGLKRGLRCIETVGD